MDSREILKYCLKKGLLIDESVLRILSETTDIETAKLILKKIKEHTSDKVLTKDIFEKNKEVMTEFFLSMPSENRKKLEKLKVKLGLSIEISKEISEKKFNKEYKEELEAKPLKILSKSFSTGKKYTVKDFVGHFRNRYVRLRNILQKRSDLKNLISINKISGNGSRYSIIGLITDRRITKNKNILFEVEDLTGTIKVLVNQNKKEIYEKALDISLDSVIAFSGSGNREIFFANDVFYPDSALPLRKKSPVEEYALFIGDVQVGNKIYMEKNFLEFIDYLNKKKENPEVSKIKYLFIVGDIVEGVGVFPKQEKELKIADLEAQFARVAEILSKVRRDITIVISPGNHDGVRLMEPQPTFDEKYAWPLYNLKNVILTGNPSLINFGAKRGFEGFNLLTYHGFSYPYYADNVYSFIEEGDALNNPTKIMKYLLKNRHLAPSHKSVQSEPLEEDGLVIEDVPDIFVSGHTHKMDIDSYNNTLLISTSTWEAQNKYQERMGNKPDFCKVPMLNLKTGQIKILDFENIEDKKQEKLEVEQ